MRFVQVLDIAIVAIPLTFLTFLLSLHWKSWPNAQHVTRCRRKGAHNPGEVSADWTDEWEYGCGTRHGGQTERISMHPRDAGGFLLGTPNSLACFRCWSYFNRLVFGFWAFFLTYRTITQLTQEPFLYWRACHTKLELRLSLQMWWAKLKAYVPKIVELSSFLFWMLDFDWLLRSSPNLNL